MQSKSKRNSIVTTRLVDDTHIGFTVIGYPEAVLNLAAIAAANRQRAEWHGWGQRVVDAAAIGTTDKDDAIIPREERLKMKAEAISRVIAHYESGNADWNLRKAASRGPDHSITIQAVMDVRGLAYEAVSEYVTASAKTHNVTRTVILESLASNPAIASRIAAIRAERVAASGINSDELLANLSTATDESAD